MLEAGERKNITPDSTTLVVYPPHPSFITYQFHTDPARHAPTPLKSDQKASEHLVIVKLRSSPESLVLIALLLD